MITLKIDDIPSSNNKYIVFGVIYREGRKNEELSR